HIWLLGSGEDGAFFRNKKNVTVIPYFERDQLAQHLTEIAPDVGLLLSLVPETFSYTLSELYAAAVPVIATQVGAFNDRVDENSGWLIEPTGEALLAQLQALHANRGNLGEVKKALLNQEP